MTTPSTIFTELVSTTLRNHKREFADNFTNSNALLMTLNKRGNKRVLSGGTEITCPLKYAENGTVQRFSGYDVLNINPSDVLTAATYPWRNMAVHVTASGTELRQNSGAEALINLAKTRVEVAFDTLNNTVSDDIYSDGTATNQINGLQALVADAGTGTVGGINSTTWTFWRNLVQSAAAPLGGGAGVTPSSTTIEQLMLGLYIRLTRGREQPDFIVSDYSYYTFFEQSQTAIKRYTSDTSATAGFVSLKYKNADVFYDGDSGIPSNHMYFLNTKYLNLVVHKDADMTQVEDKQPVNQDAVVMPILLMFNLECSNRSRQGVLKA
jgi:hypothetical protein